VVLENVLQPGTIGKVEEVDAKYELLPRKTFTYNRPVGESEGPMVSMAQYEATVALYQAQNAIQIARAAGATATPRILLPKQSSCTRKRAISRTRKLRASRL